jgi:hypothetical protein
MYSKKLGELRVIDGFKFCFHRIMRDENQRRVCTKKPCNVYLNFDTHDVQIEKYNLEHNHAIIEERLIVRQKVSNIVRRKMVEQLCVRSRKMILSEISSDDLIILDTDDVHLIRKNMHTARRSKYLSNITLKHF